MNKFRNILKNNLSEAILEEKPTSYSFKVSLSLSNYKDKSPEEDLQQEYAKRDKVGAVTEATNLIKKKLKMKSLPLTTEIKAKFKTINKNASVFNITVTGSTSLLQKLTKAKL